MSNSADRKAAKAALYSAFQKEGAQFVDHPLSVTYWVHGGEPGTGSDALDIFVGSGTCKARYVRERFQGGAKPFKVDRFEMALTPERTKALLESLFKSGLFEVIYPSETQPPIADILKETWELKSEGTDLQVTFFQKFPKDLESLRAACKTLMQELEIQNRSSGQ